MNKIYFTLFSVLLLLISTISVAQIKKASRFKFEVGVEGGLTSDYLKVRDNAGNLQRGRILFSGTGGPKVRLWFNNNFFMETAFMFKENAFGFNFKQQPEDAGSWATNGSEIFFIPMRIGYNYNLSKKISLNIMAGIAPGFITLHAGASGSGTLNPGSISFSYQMRDEYMKTYLTLTSGVSLSHQIGTRFKFSAGVNLYYGTSNAEVYDVNYTINSDPLQRATILNRGSFINYNFGLSYLLKNRHSKIK